MKQTATFISILLCVFACNSKDGVNTIEKSIEPTKEMKTQEINLLDGLEIMDYIYSIIDSTPSTRAIGFPFNDGREFNLTSEQRALIANTFPRPLFTNEKKELQNYFPCVDYKEEKIIFSQKELSLISERVKKCIKDPRFESLIKQWKEAWEHSFCSNTRTTRELPQYAELKAMGKEIIPLLIDKMATDDDYFFAIELYNDLQDNPDLIIRYEYDDPRILEDLHLTVKKTIKKWLDTNVV